MSVPLRLPWGRSDGRLQLWLEVLPLLLLLLLLSLLRLLLLIPLLPLPLRVLQLRPLLLLLLQFRHVCPLWVAEVIVEACSGLLLLLAVGRG